MNNQMNANYNFKRDDGSASIGIRNDINLQISPTYMLLCNTPYMRVELHSTGYN